MYLANFISTIGSAAVTLSSGAPGSVQESGSPSSSASAAAPAVLISQQSLLALAASGLMAVAGALLL